MTLPAGIFEATTRPEPTRPAPVKAQAMPGQGGDPTEDVAVEPAEPAGGKAPKARRRKAAVPSEKVEDMKLYLTEDVRFRLRMLAFKRGAKLSTVANEVLDRALPRWTLERTE
jgi:hypothetical protein